MLITITSDGLGNYNSNRLPLLSNVLTLTFNYVNHKLNNFILLLIKISFIMQMNIYFIGISIIPEYSILYFYLLYLYYNIHIRTVRQ